MDGTIRSVHKEECIVLVVLVLHQYFNYFQNQVRDFTL